MPLISKEPCFSCSSTGSGHEETLYRNDVPAFAVESLCALYGSLYGVLPALQARKRPASDGISTYVRRRRTAHGGLPDTVLMFRREGRRVCVLNEGVQLGPTAMEAFCDYVFGTMPDTAQIDFHAIVPVEQLHSTAKSAKTRRSLSWPCTEDIVIRLPESADAYLSQLGKATRKSIRKYLSRAYRDLPEFTHQVIPGSVLGEARVALVALVRHIVMLNHARMAQQGRESAINESATQELIDLIHSCGEVGVVTSGTRLCAGTLACRIGNDVFSLVNAHDPAFDSLGLGNVCRHLMILHAINTGAKRFHLMGGNLPSKQSTLAERQPLHHVTVYNTTLAMLRDLRNISSHAGRACMFRLHCWAEDQQASAPGGWTGRTMLALRKWLRRRPAVPQSVTAYLEPSLADVRNR